MLKIFCVLCHRINNSLISTIEYLSSDKSNIILIHIDAKVNNIDDYKKLEKPNVILIENRVKVQWGHFSIVLATIELMKISLSFNYDYFFLVSGDDFPVMTLERMDDFLSDNFGCDFIHYQDERNNYINPYERFSKIYSKLEFKKNKNFFELTASKLYNKFFFRKNSKGLSYINSLAMRLHKGTQWFTLKKSTIQYILKYINKNTDLIYFFEKSFCADEMFFHSIIKTIDGNIFYHNPNVMNDCLRFIDWASGPQFPKELTIDDFYRIKQSGCFFARKASCSLSNEDFKSLIKK